MRLIQGRFPGRSRSAHAPWAGSSRRWRSGSASGSRRAAAMTGVRHMAAPGCENDVGGRCTLWPSRDAPRWRRDRIVHRPVSIPMDLLGRSVMAWALTRLASCAKRSDGRSSGLPMIASPSEPHGPLRGRGATARQPATYGSAGSHIGTAFSCTCTPMSDVHARIGTDPRRFAFKLRPREPARTPYRTAGDHRLRGTRIAAGSFSSTIRSGHPTGRNAFRSPALSMVRVARSIRANLAAGRAARARRR